MRRTLFVHLQKSGRMLWVQSINYFPRNQSRCMKKNLMYLIHGVNNIVFKQYLTENVLLAYFDEMSKTKKSSTLWASYSMLRACLNIYKDLDITKFMRLRGFLKRQSEGYQPKKSKILEASQIDRFLNEANDLSYLATKVGLIYELANAFVYIGKALFEALRARKLDSPAQHTAHLFYMSLAATSLPHTPMRRYLQHVH